MAAIPELEGQAIVFVLDGREVKALPSETILQAARRHGVEIPHLCYKDGLRPDGNCRVCVVEITGERPLAPSCCRTPSAGMQVSTTSERARHSQKMVWWGLPIPAIPSWMPGHGRLRSANRASPPVSNPNTMGRIRQLLSILTRVFSVRAVSAPAGRNRSTM